MAAPGLDLREAQQRALAAREAIMREVGLVGPGWRGPGGARKGGEGANRSTHTSEGGTGTGAWSDQGHGPEDTEAEGGQAEGHDSEAHPLDAISSLAAKLRAVSGQARTTHASTGAGSGTRSSAGQASREKKPRLAESELRRSSRLVTAAVNGSRGSSSHSSSSSRDTGAASGSGVQSKAGTDDEDIPIDPGVTPDARQSWASGPTSASASGFRAASSSSVPGTGTGTGTGSGVKRKHGIPERYTALRLDSVLPSRDGKHKYDARFTLSVPDTAPPALGTGTSTGLGTSTSGHGLSAGSSTAEAADEHSLTVVVPFGARGYTDYTISPDENRRMRYLTRFASAAWDDPLSAAALSRWILWEKADFQQGVKIFRDKFQC